MNIKDIQAAAERIKGHVKRTPLDYSRSLSKRLGINVYVKYELFQKAGSFKVRGAFNKILSLSESERSAGVVAVSGGNHAQAVAYAARELGIRSVILMPNTTPKNSIEATLGYGAELDLQPTIADAFARIDHYVSEEGMTMVHPFDDPLVIAGQGTMGLEIAEDLPHVTDIITSIGGGGMAVGVAVAVKQMLPGTRAWGVETAGADAMSLALAAGEPVTLPAITSIAKTLGAPFVSQLTLDLVQEYLESVIVVSDAEAVKALVFIAERLKVLTEPSASCTLAAAERLKDNFGPDTHLVLVLCGGNVGIADLCGYLAAGDPNVR